MKSLLNIGVILLFGYGAMLLYVFLAQARLLYLPNFAGDKLIATPARLGLTFEDVRFEAADGITLHGWYIPAPAARGTLLFMHGNAGNISHRLESIERFHRLGLNVFIFDYRGYGESAGHPTEKGTYLDARAAFNWLTQVRGMDASDLIVFGRSLGGAVAARLATEVRPAGLIIESAFTSVPDAAASIYWFLPVKLLSRFKYNTRAAVQEVACPVLIVHSRDDEIIPFSHGQALYDAAAQPKSLLVLEGGHNDAIFTSMQRYEQGLRSFLDGVLPQRLSPVSQDE